MFWSQNNKNVQPCLNALSDRLFEYIFVDFCCNNVAKLTQKVENVEEFLAIFYVFCDFSIAIGNFYQKKNFEVKWKVKLDSQQAL